MSIINTIPGSTTTTKYSCRNLVQEIIDGKNILQADLTYLENVLLRRLDKGIISANCKVCCPDCGSLYVIGNTNALLVLQEAMGTILDDCCKNIKTDEETSVGCANSQFTQCLQQLQTIIGNTNYNTLVNLGIIEYSTIAGKTTICAIIEELQKSPVYSATFLFNAIKLILESGIVIYCNNDISLVSSVETYIGWIESVNTQP